MASPLQKLRLFCLLGPDNPLFWATTCHHRTRRHSSTATIPGPKSYPIIGCLPTLLTDKDFDQQKIYIYFQKLFRVYGPIVKVDFPGQSPVILLQNPEDIKAAFRLTNKNPVRIGMMALKKAKYSNPYYEKKGGIVVEHGEEWRRVRSQVQVPVMKPKNINWYIKHMDQITNEFLERASTLRNDSGEITVDFLMEIQKWATENLSFIALNQRIGCFRDESLLDPKTKEVTEAVKTYYDSIFSCENGGKLWMIYPTKDYQRMTSSLKILTELCDKTLQEAELKLAEKKGTLQEDDLNLIEHLLLKSNLTRKDIVTFMLDILPGGTNTTRDNVAVILYLLAKHPEAQARLQEELDQILGDGEALMTVKQYGQLSFTRAVVKEANRVMPPMFGPVRQLQEDLQFRGYTFKKGWSMLFLGSLLGMEESKFQQADKFLPERWMRDRPLGHIDQFIVLPFSYGTRMCVGRRIAEQATFIMLARICHKYTLEWKHEDMVRDYKGVFSPRGPLTFTLTERR